MRSVLRVGILLMANAGVIAATGDTAPDSWRRPLGHPLRAVATPGTEAPTPVSGPRINCPPPSDDPLWQEHLDAVFPAGPCGAEPAGIDLVLLDATAIGRVSTWPGDGGALGRERHGILRDRIADLDLFPQSLNV
ncbi:hypothetical protein [Streptomyces sp. NPDC002599]|uniref:hypothetical protein n=1 Tax=Streptomyces sp. NPDC002599 TaxID=3154421 RepID=UPI00332CA7EE